MIECYHYCKTGFEKIKNPLLDYAIDDNLEGELDRAGFSEQLSLTGKFTNFPALTVYRNTGCHPDMPEFMVDVKGDTRRLAWYVAEDFHSLHAVLKYLAPLTRYKRRVH